MLTGLELADHLWAAALVGGAVTVPGYALAALLPPHLRRRDAWTTWPLLGLAYWAVALYVFPFGRGLLVAAALSLAWAALRLVRRRGTDRRRCNRHAALLLLGAATYLTPVFIKHVPEGMDGARYVMNARLIAARAALPRDLAPFAPEIPFGAANHGVPAVAAIAVLGGATPSAAVLATIPLTFASLILGFFTLLRVLARRTPAAVVAVATVWLSTATQHTVDWGGFPGATALALSLLATRLLFDVLRGRRGGAAVLGLCVGALPLVHGLTAAAWLFILAPITAIAGLWLSRRRSARIVRTLAAGALALAIVIVYFLAARPHFDPQTTAWIRANVLTGTFEHSGPALLPEIAAYLFAAYGRTATIAFLAATLVLIVRRRWTPLLVILAVVTLTCFVLLNAPHEWLPASTLLYPDRVRDVPLVALGIALAAAWRALVPFLRHHPRAPLLVGALLLVLAGWHHGRHFQRHATRPTISAAAWHALCWAEQNLDPRMTYVANLYGTAGAHLPGVAGLAITDMHAHIADQYAAAEELARTRPPTHVFWIEQDAIYSPIGREHFDWYAADLRRLIAERGGTLVFADGPATIYALVPLPSP